MYIRLFGKFVAKLKEKFQDYELIKKENVLENKNK